MFFHKAIKFKPLLVITIAIIARNFQKMQRKAMQSKSKPGLKIKDLVFASFGKSPIKFAVEANYCKYP